MLFRNLNYQSCEWWIKTYIFTPLNPNLLWKTSWALMDCQPISWNYCQDIGWFCANKTTRYHLVIKRKKQVCSIILHRCQHFLHTIVYNACPKFRWHGSCLFVSREWRSFTYRFFTQNVLRIGIWPTYPVFLSMDAIYSGMQVPKWKYQIKQTSG